MIVWVVEEVVEGPEAEVLEVIAQDMVSGKGGREEKVKKTCEWRHAEDKKTSQPVSISTWKHSHQ